MKYNGELKVIDTQEKAYLLGFLYGDGNICNFLCKNKKRFSTKISIQIGDKDLILKLKECFTFFNLGEYDYSKYNKNSVKQINIRSSSKKLYDDLLLNGVYPRKSYENANKLRIPNIDKSLISHFIRGYFDADGSVYRRAKRKNLITIEFCSVSKEFLNEIDLYLKNININSWKIRIKKSKNKSKQIYYILTFIKTYEILKLIDFMYNDARISLKRKADKCLQYKPVDKVIERNLICPRCSSNKIWLNGNRNVSKRYKCHLCGKSFSIKNDYNFTLSNFVFNEDFN